MYHELGLKFHVFEFEFDILVNATIHEVVVSVRLVGDIITRWLNTIFKSEAFLEIFNSKSVLIFWFLINHCCQLVFWHHYVSFRFGRFQTLLISRLFSSLFIVILYLRWQSHILIVNFLNIIIKLWITPNILQSLGRKSCHSRQISSMCPVLCWCQRGFQDLLFHLGKSLPLLCLRITTLLPSWCVVLQQLGYLSAMISRIIHKHVFAVGKATDHRSRIHLFVQHFWGFNIKYLMS